MAEGFAQLSLSQMQPEFPEDLDHTLVMSAGDAVGHVWQVGVPADQSGGPFEAIVRGGVLKEPRRRPEEGSARL